MKFFKDIISTLFGNNSKEEVVERSKYMPEPEVPIDEKFILTFKENGGKFLYCENKDEVHEVFISILEENDWFEKEALTYEPDLEILLDENKLEYINPKNPEFLLCSCEGLIGDEGSILFSYNQFKSNKSHELPKNMIVYATTSQIMQTKSDGLRKIQEKYRTNLPTNITALDCFKEKSTNDFLQYGKEVKNLYLLLLEDY